jgi:hypothetical protein
MKKFILLLSMAVCLFQPAFGKDVDPATAMSAAKHFIAYKAAMNTLVSRQQANVSLAYQCAAANASGAAGQTEATLYYVFNVNAGDGFVIISGDDIVTPILGYSDKGAYDGAKLPPAFRKWMEGCKQQILFAREKKLAATNEILARWDELLNPKGGMSASGSSAATVAPLLSTTWNQSPYYNALCPGGSVTGCTATAMAQIMKYWNYPATGAGFHSYKHAAYGTLSADFGSTKYDWTTMPSNVSSPNNAVATLMFHCGVSVDMDYSPTSSNSYIIISASPVTNCAEYAYKTYFGYDPATIHGYERKTYSDAAWKTLLKNELDNHRPVQYAGFGNGGGHTFVCDGYDANDFFHMNWGWGGQEDGYFILDALNPGSLGTGGGEGGYNSGQQAVIGIQPVKNNTGGSAVISMNSGIIVDPYPIKFGQSFTVTADVINSGNASFSGDYCAALFTSAGNFVDYIEIISTGSSPLQPGYHYTGGLTFTYSGTLTVPGTYIIGIYYRPTDGNWYLAGNTSFANPVYAAISGPANYLQQYSAIVATPLSFVQGQPASVNVNLYNTGNYTFYGQYQAALYDLNGKYVETIGTYNETTGLPSGYYYTAPYITFSTSAVKATPGTYILAIFMLESGSSNWYLVGSYYYATPINITVVEAPLLADPYEPNNTENTAFVPSINWNGNTADLRSTGANIHVNTDYDYYQLNLAPGYNYTITARVHDSNNSGDGNTYTVDVLLSYKTGGVWSDAYDDVLPGNIIVNGAGSVTFYVSPYFAGETGTYLLDVHVVRTPSTSVSAVPVSAIPFEIFPNPVGNTIQLRYSDHVQVKGMRIINSAGQVVDEIHSSFAPFTIDVSKLPIGTYFLEALDGEKNYSTKFIITR